MPDLPVVIAVEGPSGAGKSTVVARAAERYGWVALAEAYDRLDPRPDLSVPTPRALARVERLLLEEEARRYLTARALVDRGSTVVADTGFVGPLTYTAALEALGTAGPALLPRLVARARRLAAERRWAPPDLIVYLGTTGRIRRARASADPVRHPPDLADRHEAVARIEATFYAELLPSALPGRVRRIAADGPVDRTLGALARAVRGARPLRAPPEAARRVIDRVLRLRSAAPIRTRPAAATVKKTPLPAGAPLR